MLPIPALVWKKTCYRSKITKNLIMDQCIKILFSPVVSPLNGQSDPHMWQMGGVFRMQGNLSARWGEEEENSIVRVQKEIERCLFLIATFLQNDEKARSSKLVFFWVHSGTLQQRQWTQYIWIQPAALTFWKWKLKKRDVIAASVWFRVPYVHLVDLHVWQPVRPAPAASL